MTLGTQPLGKDKKLRALLASQRHPIFFTIHASGFCDAEQIEEVWKISAVKFFNF
jgi:hypothetical protein